ncbi:MAG: ABC transporter substrate-binding protein [Actinomycetota bacterium]|nr:ABC transporter substrate-binding protein [Actinomycetota bacterium]
MQSHSMRWRFVLLLAVFALVAAACGGTDDATDETTTTAAEAAETTTTAAPTDETTTTAAPVEPVEPPTDENQLSGLTVVDDKTFTVELTVADPEFPVQLAYTAYFALPSVAYENTLGYNKAPIGNGPYMFPEGGEWQQDTAIDLVTNPNYAGDAPANDGVNFVISPDPKTNYLEAQAGNLDVLSGIDPDFLPSAPTDFPDRFAQSPSTGILYMAFPQYLDDTFTKEHRQALSMAIDRELIIEKIFNNSGTAAHSAIPSNLGGRDDVCASWNYDPDAAKALWDAAGPIDGFDVWFNQGGGHETWIEAVVNMWDNTLGLDSANIVFQTAEWADYLDHADNGEFTGPFRLGWGMDYPSPLNFLEPLYASYMTAADGGSNASEYNSPEFDAALAAGKEAVAASGNLADGVPSYEAAEDILCDDARTMPIRFGLNQFVWNEGVENVYMDAYGNVGLSLITADDGFVSMDITNPASLFPMDANESEGTQVLMGNLFTGLVQFDADTGEQYMANAESITSEDGGLTWTVVLRDGWTFHNGEPVTAQSYVDAWSFGARSELGFQNNGFYKKFVGYEELNAG